VRAEIPCPNQKEQKAKKNRTRTPDLRIPLGVGGSNRRWAPGKTVDGVPPTGDKKKADEERVPDLGRESFQKGKSGQDSRKTVATQGRKEEFCASRGSLTTGNIVKGKRLSW